MSLSVINEIKGSKEYFKKEIEKYKYIRYKNVHVYPKIEIKPDLDVEKLNKYVKNTIFSLHRSISKDKTLNKSLLDMVIEIYEYREGLEKIIKNNKI